MSIKTITVLSCVLLFGLRPHQLSAQEKGAAPKESRNEVSLLRAKVEQQEAQITGLLESLQRQSELIEQQSNSLAALRQKIEQDSKPTVAAVMEESRSAAQIAQIGSIESKAAVTSKTTQNVETGYGKIKFNGLLQGWYAAGNSGIRNTFRIRRSELKFSGKITPWAGWTVMIDPSKALTLNNSYTVVDGSKVVSDTSVNQASRMLQDAFITFDYRRNVRVNIGQFKTPLSMEGLQSSAALDTVERALFASDRARGGTYGDVRDLGVMIHGPLTSSIDYQLGLFNGSGENQNDLDKNNQKAVAGRLVARPRFLRGLQIGGSGVWGNGSGPGHPRRDRLGAELLFKRDAFLVKSELMTGKDSDLNRLGYYAHVGYRLTPRMEAIFRVDRWDPDTRLETDSTNIAEQDFVTGINYYVTENNVKFQVNYLRKTFAGQVTPSRNLILINLQTSW